MQVILETVRGYIHVHTHDTSQEQVKMCSISRMYMCSLIEMNHRKNEQVV